MRILRLALRAFVGVAVLAALYIVFKPEIGPASPLEELAAKSDALEKEPAETRSRRIFGLVRATLDEAGDLRRRLQIDPESPIEEALWRQVGLDDRGRAGELIAAAFELVVDSPVVAMQQEIEARRAEIATMRRQIAELREEQISAPADGGLETWLGLEEDQESLASAITDIERRIAGQEARIDDVKRRFAASMTEAGAPMTAEQAELLLDSVTGADMVELAAAYEAVRGVSVQLRDLMDASNEDLEVARRYYSMHTVLIAVLAEGQTRILRRIDVEYLPRLAAIEADLVATAADTRRLLDADPTPDHRRALEANAASQRVALDALRLYREYLLSQRVLVARARERTLRELEVADNTLRTVEASFQLKELMDSAATSFDALMAMESPGVERLFHNEELRREFQNLTERLAPS